MSVLCSFIFNTCLIVFAAVFVTDNVHAQSENIVSVASYFPQIDNDLTKVTWAHAVNNRAKLNASLNDDSMMIEADVLMGQLEGSLPGENPLPIMGHPPATTSDLSLEEFLTEILSSNKKKGIKLDFKSQEVFAGSENILEEVLVKPEADFPIWLNADVLSGPVASTKVPLDADYFVSTVIKKFPNAMLSVGWTTRLGGDITFGKYTEDNINNMTDVLARNAVIHPVTFPVRAAIAANSKEVLSSLVRTSPPGTTLTIWSSISSDTIDIFALRSLINEIGRDKCFLDLPQSMIDEINEEMPNENSASVPLRMGAGFLSIICISALKLLSI